MSSAKKDIFSYRGSSPPPAKEGGLLSGEVLVVQPSISVRGWPTEAGSLALEGFTALEDATVVKRLRASGGVIAGSTRMSELGFGLAGDTAAAAVAGGHARTALMIDAMGEARVAASGEGLVGFKPSYGTVSRLGLIGLIPSMECCGLVAGSVPEIARVMEALSGTDPDDFSMPEVKTSSFSGCPEAVEPLPAVGVVRESMAGMEPELAGSFKAVIFKIESFGMKVEEVGLADFDLCRTVHNIIGSVEASSSAGKYDGVRYGHRAPAAKNWNEMYLKSRAECFGMPLKAYLFQGAYFQYRNYQAFVDACRVRGRLKRQVEGLFEKIGALIFPARPPGIQADENESVGRVYDLFAWTVLPSLTGHPSVTLSGFVPGREADLGLQLVGPVMGDARLLSLAHKLANLNSGGN